LHTYKMYVIESAGRGYSDVTEKFQTVYQTSVRCGVLAQRLLNGKSRDRAEYFTKSFRADFRSGFPPPFFSSFNYIVVYTSLYTYTIHTAPRQRPNRDRYMRRKCTIGTWCDTFYREIY